MLNEFTSSLYGASHVFENLTEYTYDTLNRLVTYDCGSKHLEYTYDVVDSLGYAAPMGMVGVQIAFTGIETAFLIDSAVEVATAAVQYYVAQKQREAALEYYKRMYEEETMITLGYKGTTADGVLIFDYPEEGTCLAVYQNSVYINNQVSLPYISPNYLPDYSTVIGKVNDGRTALEQIADQVSNNAIYSYNYSLQPVCVSTNVSGQNVSTPKVPDNSKLTVVRNELVNAEEFSYNETSYGKSSGNSAYQGGNGSDLDGIRIINKKYAGKTYELSGDLAKKYPKGVNFSNEGFPEFEPYSIKKLL